MPAVKICGLPPFSSALADEKDGARSMAWRAGLSWPTAAAEWQAAAVLPERVAPASGRERPLEAECLSAAEQPEAGALRADLAHAPQAGRREVFQAWEPCPEPAGHRAGQHLEAWDGRAAWDGPADP